MLKFMDGFDQFAGQSDLTAALSAAGYVVTGAVALAEGRKPTTQAVQLEGAFKRTFSSSAQRVVIGFAYKANVARSSIVTVKDVLTLTWEDGIGIGGAKGSAIPLINLWYYYEIAIDKVADEIRVYINNELDLTVPLPASANFVTVYETSWATNVAGGPKQLDDLVFIDSASGRFQDRLGPVQLSLRLPDADTVSDFSPSSGVNHYPLINKVPPVPGNYIQSNVSGAADTFTSSDPAGSGELLAVGMVVSARKSDIDNRQMGMMIGDSAGVNKEVLQTQLELTPTFSYAVFETTPSGAVWDETSLLATPFGIVVRP